jgi:hypothetical protein
VIAIPRTWRRASVSRASGWRFHEYNSSSRKLTTAISIEAQRWCGAFAVRQALQVFDFKQPCTFNWLIIRVSPVYCDEALRSSVITTRTSGES